MRSPPTQSSPYQDEGDRSRREADSSPAGSPTPAYGGYQSGQPQDYGAQEAGQFRVLPGYPSGGQPAGGYGSYGAYQVGTLSTGETTSLTDMSPTETGSAVGTDAEGQGQGITGPPSRLAGRQSGSFNHDKETDMARSTFSSGTGENQAQVIGGDPTNEGPGPEIMAADTLEGDDVVNTKGEDLGNIKDIMIDVPSGRVAYAVLSSGGFLGLGDKLFAIPWSALTLDADRKCFILDVDKETLKNAPGFDKDHWPAMADPTWAQQVHDYYGQRGYWAGSTSLGAGTAPGAGMGTGTGVGSSTGMGTGAGGLGSTGRTEIGPEDV